MAESYARMLPDASYEAPLDLAMIGHFVAQLAKDARVLDAGCGAGRMIDYLTQLNPSLHIEGVDLSPAMVEVARAAYPDVRIKTGELGALSYQDGEFDGVLAWYSLIHCPSEGLGPIFDELYRVLAPGGVVLTGFQSGEGEWLSTRPYGHIVELRSFLRSTDQMARCAESAGLVVIARLDRGARKNDRHSQGFILARRP
ncbi:class I SAM-dependent DNA methyltransferase [Gryllotalpicola reticulitermitis]|uniref:Class I SAM-dependent DNA methyltransferase n=1 Tax=Gryllotalpicola reticulitermitis TaxID=1184153 RepID=A0ABV8Q9W1_9MICO